MATTSTALHDGTGSRRPLDARTAALLVAVGLAFADASVVALALPDLYLEFETSIVGVSWVLTVYAAVAALVGLFSSPITARLGEARTTVVGLAMFAGASVACGLAASLPTLLVARGVQAVGAAALLEGSLGVMASGAGSVAFARRAWIAAGTIGAVVGPALGGLVTQLTDWRAVFLIQAPVALLAVPAVRNVRGRPEQRVAPPAPARSAPGALLADLGHMCTFAGLVGALFLAVLLLVVVWGMEPLAGALVVSALPIGTVGGWAITERRPDALAVACGAVLLAAGLLTLALLPATSVMWVAAGLLAAGAGFGLLASLLGPLAVPDDADLAAAAARSSAARHLGLVVGLLVVAPLVATGVEAGADRATLNGTAVVLDARTGAVQKAEVAWDIRTLLADAEAAEVPDLDAIFEPYGDGDDVIQLRDDLREAIEASITRGFRSAFVGGAALALLGLLPAVAAVTRARAGAAAAGASPHPQRRAATVALGGAVVVALALPVVAWAGDAPQFGTYDAADPCAAGADPFSGDGFDELIQRSLLSGLNGAACELGTTREQLVLSLDPDAAIEQRRWDDETIERALKAGAKRAIDDADERDSLPGLAADVLRFSVDRAPLRQLIGWIGAI